MWQKKDGEYEIVAVPAILRIRRPWPIIRPLPEAESIKGLFVDPQKLGTSELDDLG
ncbi:MAG: hypothetical protein ACLUOI_05440 [Eisenbergiella sp.]